MAFIGESKLGYTYAPGYFLASEKCVRITATASLEDGIVTAQAVTTDDGAVYLPAGSVYEDEDAAIYGFVYEDVDLSNGDAPASIVVSGSIYVNRCPWYDPEGQMPDFTGFTYLLDTDLVPADEGEGGDGEVNS